MFSETFIQIALAVGILSGGLCAYLGNFILLKNMTFLSVALSEIAALGVAFGFLIVGWLEPTFHSFLESNPRLVPNIMGFLATAIAIIFFWRQSKKGQESHEGFLGFLYGSSAALTIVLVSQNPLLEARGSMDLIEGTLIFCSAQDLKMMSILTLLIGGIHFLSFRYFFFVSFDRETAQAQGIHADFWELLLMMTIGLCISFSMSLTGVLFVFASLIIPGLTALNVLRNITLIFCFSIAMVILSVFLGMTVSYYYNWPTSPAIICMYSLFFMVSLLLKKIFKLH